MQLDGAYVSKDKGNEYSKQAYITKNKNKNTLGKLGNGHYTQKHNRNTRESTMRSEKCLEHINHKLCAIHASKQVDEHQAW